MRKDREGEKMISGITSPGPAARIKVLFLAAAALILFVFASTRATWGETLDDLVHEALENNLEVQASRERWQATEARTPSAWALPDPRFGISYQKNPGPVYSLGEARMRMLTFSQTIPFPLKLTARAGVYGAQARQAGWQDQVVRQDVVARVKIAYYQLFVMQRSADILGEQIDLLRAMERTARNQYAVGRAPQHEVLKAQVELSLMMDELDILGREKIPAARARLQALLNRSADDDVEIPGDLDLPSMTLTEERLFAIAQENRPGLAARQEEVEKAAASLSLARWGYFPDLTISLMQERMETSLGTETTNGFTLTANLPLWFWGQRADVSEKKGLRAGALDLYGDLQSQTRAEVQENLAAYQAARSRADLVETTILPLAEQSLKAARAAYENREADFLDLISAQRNLADARLKRYQALGDAGTSLAHLERVVGIQFSDEEEIK
jgi:cobalt-zinc-cadmium efflux system outer membrane protein